MKDEKTIKQSKEEEEGFRYGAGCDNTAYAVIKYHFINYYEVGSNCYDC